MSWHNYCTGSLCPFLCFCACGVPRALLSPSTPRCSYCWCLAHPERSDDHSSRAKHDTGVPSEVLRQAGGDDDNAGEASKHASIWEEGSYLRNILEHNLEAAQAVLMGAAPSSGDVCSADGSGPAAGTIAALCFCRALPFHGSLV
eukprot:TRINITY_DN6754_c1_g1_i1.p1 TRINITY_DN6754_c1_g1~~TRINITY_DN6754_c1_g1_i1.p1  ORF type:complete len:145 (+),score=6.08 TRINITY_DN6754_c1_g1_i1:665-1099(+)